MKCITNGVEVRRVSDREAEHYISREGWNYCQKKQKVEGYICSKCGKSYKDKPEKCNGKITVQHKNKDGFNVNKKVFCDSKVFNKGTIFVPVWR